MAAIVVLSFTLAVFAAGAAGIAGLQLLRGAQRLKAEGERTAARLGPVAEELRAELAITEAELASLSQPSSTRQEARGTRPHG